MSEERFSHRIAFGVWINDIRNEPISGENWPSVIIDRRTLEDFKRTVRLLKEAGYTDLDIFGLLTNRDWPLQIDTVISPTRKRQVDVLIEEAHRNDIRVIYGLGVYSWGFDTIIKNDQGVRGTNPSAMCGSKRGSQRWMRKVIDFVTERFDVDGFHLEAADQGRCRCSDCSRESNLEYFCRLNRETADYIRDKLPGILLLVNTSGFLPWGDFVQKKDFLTLNEMGKSIDVLIDGGNHGLFIHEDSRREFIAGFPCHYGTSGGFWIYPPQRWDRLRWFLPYIQTDGEHLKRLHGDGSRACELYLGPLENPATEMNVFCNGRLLSDVTRQPADVLGEAIDGLYRPRSGSDNDKLKEVFLHAERAFLDSWSARRKWGLPAPYTDGIEPLFEWSNEHPERAIPGELFLEPLLGSSPGFPVYLAVHMSREGRHRYRAELLDIRRAVAGLGRRYRDSGRIGRIGRCLENLLQDLDTVDSVAEL
jgi:hypothetical protein